MAVALAPDEAGVQRIPCSTAGHADDLVLRVPGTGSGRLLLLGHLDTVIAHAEHRALQRDPERPERLVGSGSVDMKGGVVLALGVLRALAQDREEFAEVALLLVCDEEWRPVISPTSSGSPGSTRACASRPVSSRPAMRTPSWCIARRREPCACARMGAQRTPARRPRREPMRCSRSPRQRGRSRRTTTRRATYRLTCVPTVMQHRRRLQRRSGSGELVCDVRADNLAAFQRVLAAVPASVDGVTLACDLVRSGRAWTRVAGHRGCWRGGHSAGPTDRAGRAAAGPAMRAISPPRSR